MHSDEASLILYTSGNKTISSLKIENFKIQLPTIPAQSRAYVILKIKDEILQNDLLTEFEMTHAVKYKVVHKYLNNSKECVCSLDFIIPLEIKSEIKIHSQQSYLSTQIINHSNFNISILSIEITGCKEKMVTLPFNLSSRQILHFACMINDPKEVVLRLTYSSNKTIDSKMLVVPFIEKLIKNQIFEHRFNVKERDANFKGAKKETC